MSGSLYLDNCTARAIQERPVANGVNGSEAREVRGNGRGRKATEGNEGGASGANIRRFENDWSQDQSDEKIKLIRA